MARLTSMAIGAAAGLWLAAGLGGATGEARAAETLGIAAGLPGSQSARMAEDIAAVLRASGMQAAIHGVPGAFGPMMAARHTPGIHIAIVSGDVPAFLSRRASIGGPEAGSQAATELASVMALEARTVHLIAADTKFGIEDLAGARVGIGPMEEPGAITAVLLMDAARIRPGRIDTAPLGSAIAALQAGDLDAVFVTAPVPDPLVARAIDRADRLALLPISSAGALAGHEPADIPAGAYSFAPDGAPSVAVRGALVAYLYGGETCEAIGAAASALGAALPSLSRRGVPAWQTVRPEAATGFAPHPCAGADLGAGPAVGSGDATADATADAAPGSTADAPSTTPEQDAARQNLMNAIGSFLGGDSQ